MTLHKVTSTFPFDLADGRIAIPGEFVNVDPELELEPALAGWLVPVVEPGDAAPPVPAAAALPPTDELLTVPLADPVTEPDPEPATEPEPTHEEPA